MSDDDIRQPPTGGSRPTTLACPDNIPPETLSAWRDGLLLNDQAARLERHTPACAACSERLRDYDAASSALNTQIIPRPGADLWPGVRAAIEREARGVAHGSAHRGLRFPRGLALGGIGAAVAALLLIALFAGLLFSHTLGHITTAATPSTTTSPNPTATATVAPTQPPKGVGIWTTMTGCPDVAPPSVRTIYDAAVTEQKGAPTVVVFRRSGDCGMTWTPFTPPSISGVDYATDVGYTDAFINPLNPQIAYLDIQVTGGVISCTDFVAAGAKASLSSMPCLQQFVTTNGGASWSHLSLPVRGSLAIASPTGPAGAQNALRTQGSLLYGVVTNTIPGMSGVVPPGRLVVSNDGVHWTIADAALAAQGLGVYDVAVTPTGSTVYVTAQPFNDPNDQAPTYAPTLSMWSSPDGGKTWAENAHAPDGGYGQGGAVVSMAAGQAGSQPILYIIASDKNGHTQLLASRDRGRNWTIDTQFATGGSYQLLGALPDGSALLETSDPSQPTLAWTPGTGEQGVAAGAGFQSIINVALPSADGGGYLWLTGVVDNNGTLATLYTQLKP